MFVIPRWVYFGLWSIEGWDELVGIEKAWLVLWRWFWNCLIFSNLCPFGSNQPFSLSRIHGPWDRVLGLGVTMAPVYTSSRWSWVSDRESMKEIWIIWCAFFVDLLVKRRTSSRNKSEATPVPSVVTVPLALLLRTSGIPSQQTPKARSPKQRTEALRPCVKLLHKTMAKFSYLIRTPSGTISHVSYFSQYYIQTSL